MVTGKALDSVGVVAGTALGQCRRGGSADVVEVPAAVQQELWRVERRRFIMDL